MNYDLKVNLYIGKKDLEITFMHFLKMRWKWKEKKKLLSIIQNINYLMMKQRDAMIMNQYSDVDLQSQKEMEYSKTMMKIIN